MLIFKYLTLKYIPKSLYAFNYYHYQWLDDTLDVHLILYSIKSNNIFYNIFIIFFTIYFKIRHNKLKK